MTTEWLDRLKADLEAERSREAKMLHRPEVEEYIRRTVAAAPPLSPEQRDRLALLLKEKPDVKNR